MPTEEEKNVFLEALEKEKTVSIESVQGASSRLKKQLSGTALFATLFLVFLLIITLLIFIMSVGGANNPILQSFGVQSGQVKDFLQAVLNWTFGTLIILLLLLFTIGLFRGISLPAEQKEKKRNALFFGLVSGGLIFAVVLAWLLIYAYIVRLPASASVGSEIQILNIEPGEKIVAPLTISFSATGIEQELQRQGKQILDYRWDRDGDGTFEVNTGQDPKADLWFTESGRQVVHLMVELKGEAPQTFSVEFVVDAVVFAAVPDQGPAPLSVAFDAQEVTQQLSVKSFEWDFDGDNTYEESSASPKITHIFSNIGTFSVQLRVILQDGQVRTFNRNITVNGSTTERLKAVIDATPLQGDAPLKVDFSGRNSFANDGKITKYTWDMGDDTILRGDEATHTFQKSGTYRVALTVENDQGLSNTATVEITVSGKTAAPLIRIKSIPAATLQKEIIIPASPADISFDASDTSDAENDIVSFSWDFGDGKTPSASGEKVSHTFAGSGKFPVVLKVTDAAGNVSTEQLMVVLQGEAVQALIQADPETGSVPLTINFDGAKSGCGEKCEVISYEWDFGDGTPVQITGAHTAHTFTKVGTYTVKMKITTDGGKTATGQKIVAVRVPPLKACFTPSRTSGTAPLTVSFSDCSAGTIATWKWDFGDGVITSEHAPEHVFQKSGTYTITLTVTDENSTTSEVSQTLTVQ